MNESKEKNMVRPKYLRRLASALPFPVPLRRIGFYSAIIVTLFACLQTGCKRKIDTGKSELRIGSEPAGVIEFGPIGPIETGLQGVPTPNWRPAKNILSAALEPGKVYRIGGEFMAVPGCSAPQLMYVRLCPRRGETFNLQDSVTSENPVPVFEGEFGSEKSTFLVDIRIPEGEHMFAGPAVIVLTAVEITDSGMRQVVIAELKTSVSIDAPGDQKFVVTPLEK